jgi:saccharopine dehydrogenase-like NADP-dependent oxidoreductase
MAKFALDAHAHYVNLTEYVAETKQIMEMAKDAQTGFGLQSGVAPGFVNVLGKRLFEEFCQTHKVDKANSLEMRVGALGRNAVSPHFYAFTWSTIGVATEYVKPAEVVRNHQFMTVPSLSERKTVLVDGLLLEEDLTSGGAADIPMTYKDVIANIDYKTFRYPGHWAWVDGLLQAIPESQDVIHTLETEMLKVVPAVEDDLIIVFAAVEGADYKGQLRRIEASYRVEPKSFGAVTMRAIQSTTAAGMAEVARMLLEQSAKGVVLQSQLDTENYLSGPFVSAIYGLRR